MSDFLSFLYAHYIRPYLDTRPMDDGDIFRASLCENNQTEETRKDVEAVVAFYDAAVVEAEDDGRRNNLAVYRRSKGLSPQVHTAREEICVCP